MESENVSENTGKPGRPRLTPPEWDRLWGRLHPGLSRRGYLDRLWGQRAFGLLFDDDGNGNARPKEPAFAHLLRGAGGPKQVILSELGRLPEDDVLALARQIGARRLSTAAAVALIRRARLGDAPPRGDRLVDALISAIDHHRRRYPATSGNDIAAALDEVAEVVRVVNRGNRLRRGGGTSGARAAPGRRRYPPNDRAPEGTMSDSSRDRIEGAVDEAAGRGKAALGGLTGDERTQAEGEADRAEGGLKQGLADAKDTVDEAVKKTTDR